MNSRFQIVVACAVAALAAAALAQGGPGAGQGAGPSASAPGMGPGMQGQRGPRARSGPDFTPGWSMMAPAERREHQARMGSMKSYEACTSYMEQHHEQMAARAKDRGGKALARPRRDACAGLKP